METGSFVFAPRAGAEYLDEDGSPLAGLVAVVDEDDVDAFVVWADGEEGWIDLDELEELTGGTRAGDRAFLRELAARRAPRRGAR